MNRRPLICTLFPYTTLFRSSLCRSPPKTSSPVSRKNCRTQMVSSLPVTSSCAPCTTRSRCSASPRCCSRKRSEEHTSELQSHSDLVCRLLLEKKKQHKRYQS